MDTLKIGRKVFYKTRDVPILTHRSGNTVLKLNQNWSVITEEEKQAVLDYIGELDYEAGFKKAIMEAQETA
ncbi:MAG: hypothetical protein LUD81_02890 [Clostridiales bacterium]|nr:hypothetical protein [Clostridiales bacterium]